MNTPLITIYVEIINAHSISSDDASVNMIVFKARAEGELFNGSTVFDGVDTQTFESGSFKMSARYMLEGRDFKGSSCKLFIENNGSTLDNCTPKIFTDSQALSYLNSAKLYAKGESIGDGVIIKIYSSEQDQ